MAIRVIETQLPGVLVIESDIHADGRGFFKEVYRYDKYLAAGLDMRFVQDNHSHSVKGVLRGLHYQLNSPQGKLVMAVTGEVFDVAVDIRKGSPNFGKWTGVYLSLLNNRQVYVPGGFAHGFCVLSDSADVIYKSTGVFDPDDQYGVLWSDPDINIEWPVADPVLSVRDAENPALKEISEGDLPDYI
jgi:dTDP-4-dehydrorhamnose 3,5-epimerase